jgi:excinuclease ABC subunit B
MRDELKRLRTTEMAIIDDPTAKRLSVPLPRKGPRKPGLDEMGPGVESVPVARGSGRSTMGKPGMRGGFKRKGR